MIARRLVIALAPLLIAAAPAPRLRPMTTLAGPVVRLGDLFAHAGSMAGRVLGPGPAPGGRIVVAARQLAYIARTYDVDWHPASPSDRAVLAWPGRPFGRAETMAPLRAALLGAGAGPHDRILLDRFDPPMVPLAPAMTPAISALAYDPGSGRFSALLMLSGGGIEPITAPIAGRVEATALIPVATRRLPTGAVLAAGDLRLLREPLSAVAGGAARGADQVIGRELTQPIAAGMTFPVAALRTPLLVRKGAAVLIRVESPGLALTAAGQALDGGGAGDRVRVLNPVSHAVLAALVSGPGEVRVLPGAPPLVPAGGTGVVR
ncbi:MAG: flagellar basal body P-ring formation protein FlgA [Rhodospirillales bacterium]|nr:flagellar basal body P-ring formation protein FlgA [Rhodospirillales bacterium]